MSGVILEPIELEPLDDGDDAVVLETGRRRGWSPVLIVGVAVALVAAVALVGRNGGGAAAPPAPASTVPPTTAPTTVPTTDRRSPRPSFSEHFEFANLLGTPSGTDLYGVTGDGAVVRIDLDAGRVSERRLRRGDQGDAPVTIFGHAGWAVVATANQSVVVGNGALGVVTFLAGDTSAVLPAAADDEVWLVRTIGSLGRVAERRNVTDDSVAATIYDLPEGKVLGDDGVGGLLLETGSGVYRFGDAAEGPQRVSGDPLVAWSPTTFVAQRCDDQLRCQWQEVDRASGAERALGPAPWGGSVLAAELSRDGSRIAYVGGIGGPAAPSLEVMDVATGARMTLDHSAALSSVQGTWRGLVWSTDGQWLFWVADGGSLKAWHVGDEQPITVDGAGHVPALQAIGLAR